MGHSIGLNIAFSTKSGTNNLHGSGTEQYELDYKVLPNHNQTSKFDLTVDLAETSEGLIMDFEYRTSLFTAGKIAGWTELFQKLIQEINRDPVRSVSDFLVFLKREEIRCQAVMAEEFSRQEQARFTSRKRKTVELQGVNS